MITRGGGCPVKVRGPGFRDNNHQSSRGIWGHAPPGKFGIFDPHSKRVILRPLIIPGWKGLRASVNIQRRMHGYRLRVTVRYRSVPPQTVHFRFDQKLKNHGVASTLRTFEPLEPSLQHPRLRSTISFVYCRNAIVHFFTLDHTHCHQAAGRD